MKNDWAFLPSGPMMSIIKLDFFKTDSKKQSGKKTPEKQGFSPAGRVGGLCDVP